MLLLIIKKLFNLSRNYKQITYYYAFLALLVSYTVLSISSVYYYNKHFSIILGIGSIIGNIYHKESGRKKLTPRENVKSCNY